MFLKKIEIQGFKSFAHKTELQFNRNLTSIVGPNGSGKSNISDAIRWVTGEQSQKLLRTKKAEEIIFAGSDKKSKLGMAEVSIFLDNKNKKIPLDFDEVVITRRIFRNGESEYIINKNKVRLLDIQLLLARANFGQGNYSIVGQGMIDSILNQSSASRKDFFDEATGVKEYQIKKEKSQNKYISTQNNLKQSNLILNEISPRLKYLTKQVNKLKKQEETKIQLEELQNNYYGFIISEMNTKIKEIEQKLKEKNKEKENLQIKLEHEQSEIEKEKNKNTYSREFSDLQLEYQKLIDTRNNLSHDKVVYQGKLDIEFSSNGKSNLIWLGNHKEELEKEYDQNESEITNEEKNITSIQIHLDEKIVKQENFISKINEIKSQLEEISNSNTNKDSINIKERIKRLNDSIQNVVKNIKNLSKDELEKEFYFIEKEVQYINKSVNNENSDVKTKYEEVQKEFNKYLSSKDSLVNEIFELKNQKNIIENKLTNLKRRQEDIKIKLNKIKIDIEISNSEDKSKNQKQIEEMIGDIDKKTEILNEKISISKKEIENLDKKNQENRNKLFDAQKQAQSIQNALNIINSEIQDLNINIARLQTKKEDIDNEIKYENIDLEKLNYNAKDIDKDYSLSQINKYKNQSAQIGEIEENVEEEYTKVNEKYEFLEKQLTDLEEASKNLKRIIEDLEIKIEERFNTNFKKINEAFNKYFQVLFEGGNAGLVIKKEENIKTTNTENENSEENEEEKEDIENEESNIYNDRKCIADIIISVKIPGKKLTSMNVLSGGERSLTSIALICAIIDNNPSPFVVLDEVDAALDEANSERFAEIVDMLKNKTQFICITHNRATMHKSNTLYGVTMDDNGISKILSISFNEAEKYSEQ
ncbi:MAG: chromosome segregation SMC family protein [Patescibacteria group bacterium]|nr:chromosome segregation SMC family protein [Patescibacteria group bacterium]MDD4303932.1 chromosome segregation SMC family protein [Patescibacteria group bacterium]MDD4695080.1 chromosome segregation SMC family protein [Patescibacteria group bacterium]